MIVILPLWERKSLAHRLRHRVYDELHGWRQAITSRPIDKMMMGDVTQDPSAIRLMVEGLNAQKNCETSDNDQESKFPRVLF